VKAWDVLVRAVDNGLSPCGGVMMQLEYNPDTKRYIARAEFDIGIGADAPTLDLAVRAIEHLDEGEWVSVDAEGQSLCRECPGEGVCSWCKDTTVDGSPPHAWPEGGKIGRAHV